MASRLAASAAADKQYKVANAAQLFMSTAVETAMAASAPSSPRLEAALSAAALLDPSISLLATHAAQLPQQWLLRFTTIVVALRCRRYCSTCALSYKAVREQPPVIYRPPCPAQRSTAAEPASTMLYVASSFCLYALLESSAESASL